MCKLLDISRTRMVDEAFIQSLPLTALPNQVLQLLSCLLNSEKIIPSDGPDRLPRYWRGLASRVNISAQVASNIDQFADKTARVMAIWMQQSPQATVGELLEHLEYIDRFDVRDDVVQELKVAAESGLLSRSKPNQIALPGSGVNGVSISGGSDLLTYQDRPGYVQIYDALVLYAEEDKNFVFDMLQRMNEEGFNICTIDDLQAGHATQYAPVAHLISERCRRIILVFSPEFLNSAGMNFYMDYAQAVSIESKERKILPIMYRDCTLPLHVSFYHKLYYQSNGRSMYDFWYKLRQSLEVSRPYTVQQRSMNGTVAKQLQSPTPRQIMIDEYPSDSLQHYVDDTHLFLPRNEMSTSCTTLGTLSVEPLDTAADSQSLGNLSRTSGNSETKKKKKKSTLRIFFSNKFNFKKNKKVLMVAD